MEEDGNGGRGGKDMESRRYMKWLVLLIGVLCSVGVKAKNVDSVDTLIEALGGNAVKKRNVVTLTGPIYLSETIKVTGGGEIILDLNGQTITYDKSGEKVDKRNDIAIEVNGTNANITIQNGYIVVKAANGIDYKRGTIAKEGSNAFAVVLNSGRVALRNLTMTAIPGKGGKTVINTYKDDGEAWVVDANGNYTLGDMVPYGAYFSVPSGVNYTQKDGGIKQQNATVSLSNYKAVFNINGKQYSTIANYTLNGGFSYPNYELKKGYKLSDWTTSNSNVTYVNDIPVLTDRAASGTITFNATTSLIQYKLDCNLNGGTIKSGQQPPSTYTVESPDITLPTLSKEHYEFKGWRYDLDTIKERVELDVTIKKGTSTWDRSFTAQFKPTEYPIEYNLNGGIKDFSDMETYTVETKDTLRWPRKPFYEFEGWYHNNDTLIKELNKDFYGNPLRLYAKWSPVKYDVTLYNGDTKYTMWGDLYRTVEEGLDLSSYQPTRNGYIFMGWSTDKGGKNILNTVPAENGSIDLYAQWKIVSFVIKYNTDGGTALPDEQYTLETKDDNNWKTGVHVNKNGYVFRGWFLTSDCSGNPLTGFPLDMNLGTPSADKSVITIPLYAKWEVLDYSIVFRNAGDKFIDNKQYSIEKGIPEKDMPQPTWIGRKFLGWFNEKDEPMKSVPRGTGNLILTAKWEYVKYKITYETEGGSISGEQLEYTIDDHVKLVTPTKEHYTFTGWYTQKEGGDKYMQDEFHSQTGDKVVYAHWTPKTYHLSFVTNGGSEIKGSFPFTYGKVIDIDKRTYRQAYTFEGWYLDAGFTKKYDKNTSGSIGGDLILYAKWTSTRYKIKYDMFHGVAIPDDSYSTEEEKVLPVNAIRDGFSFAGWYADVMLTNGPVTKIEKGSSGDKTFYATWKRGNFIHFLTPQNGTIRVMRRGKELASGDMVGTDVELEISAIPVSDKFRLKSLSIGDKTYTTSPQIIKMPASDLHISALFEDARVTASAPEIVTDPANTDNMLTGSSVKVTLKKTDASTTLYYSISDSPRRLYEGPFEVSSETAKLITLKAYAVKEGCKDGVAVRDMGFGVQKISVTFDLPTGITAINPLGGEVVSAIASGGAFEFSLQVDDSYFQSLDSMVVLANDSVLMAGANDIYRVEGATQDVKVTVGGLENASYKVVLEQGEHGHIYFTEDGSEGPLTLSRAKQISVTAVPELNYKFGGWTDGSQANPYTLLVKSDTTLEAIFVPDAKYYTITLPVLEGVTVKPLSNYSTEVLRGGKFHFYLRLADGYSAEDLVVKANGVVMEANADGVYSLYKIAQNYSISVEGVVQDGVTLKLADHVSAVDIATATDANKVRLYPESMLSLLATAPDGQCFYKWNDGNSDNPRIVTVREASGLLPLFQPIADDKNYARIQLPNVVGAGVGVQMDIHTIEVGGKMPFKVVLLPGYSQSEVKVTANGKPLEEGLSMRATSKSRTLVYALSNVEKEVKIEIGGLKLDTYQVEVEQSEGGQAAVSPSGQIEYGKQVSFTATPDAGNIFVKWSDGNTLNPYPVSVNDDTSLKPVFMRSDMTVANEDVEIDGTRLKVAGSTLYIETETNAPVYIWDYKGTLLYRINIPAGVYSCPLPAGIYLVKVGERRPEKVVVR